MTNKFETGRVRKVQAAREPGLVVGFTGTRKGMAHNQAKKILEILNELQPEEGHHGDCEGGDAMFHELCRVVGIPVVIHPPEDPKHRAFCQGAMRVEPERPYLVRNKIIVDTCGVLLAAPNENHEPAPARGQGTWSTVRYARRAGRRMRIVWPERRSFWIE
jgi:hypothetical protein